MNKALFMTPVVTVFDSEGKIDVPANKRVYEHLIQGGMDGLVIMGSTGEFFAMSMEQKRQMVDLAAETIKGRARLLIGTSCMIADETIELSNYAIDKGADAVMIISPYYFALSDASVEAYYDYVASHIRGDIYIYNFPARTGHDVSPKVTLSLLRKHRNIVGYKDTVSGMDHTRDLLQEIRREFPDFIVLSGFDNNFAYNVLSGGNGCIGGLSNLYPELLAGWRNAVNNRDMEKTAKLQKKVDKLFELYSLGTPFIPIVKKAMMFRGIGLEDYCSKPILQANQEQTKKIQALMECVEAME